MRKFEALLKYVLKTTIRYFIAELGRTNVLILRRVMKLYMKQEWKLSFNSQICHLMC
jgi:hypothetical protein